jgi:hypothetical protein
MTVERHESLIDAIRLCYGKVHEIITSTDVTYIMSQKYSSKLMRICIGQFGAARMACSLEESATVIIGQFLPVWYSLVVQTLSRIQSVTDMNNQLAVIIEMLRSIPVALEVFQDGCEDIFNEMMRIFWNLLCLIRDDNERSSGMTSGDSSSTCLLVLYNVPSQSTAHVLDLTCIFSHYYFLVSRGRNRESMWLHQRWR